MKSSCNGHKVSLSLSLCSKRPHHRGKATRNREKRVLEKREASLVCSLIGQSNREFTIVNDRGRTRHSRYPDGKDCCRHEARDIVRHAVGAGEQDAVLFTGQGTAAALCTLLRHLDLSKSTVVFVGPFEHHANLRPWREYGVRVRRITCSSNLFSCLLQLGRNLLLERNWHLLRKTTIQ